MEYSIITEPNGRYIYILTSGEIWVKDTQKMAIDGLAVGAKTNCLSYLIDHRNSVSKDTAAEIFDFMTGLDSLGMPRKIKIAIVISRDEEDHHFAETVAVNRGWNIRNFKNIGEAEQWL